MMRCSCHRGPDDPDSDRDSDKGYRGHIHPLSDDGAAALINGSSNETPGQTATGHSESVTRDPSPIDARPGRNKFRAGFQVSGLGIKFPVEIEVLGSSLVATRSKFMARAVAWDSGHASSRARAT